MTVADFQQWLLESRKRTLVMGVLNVTPDSFSDGGRNFSTDAAVAAALGMIADGADVLDIGGESTRPGAAPVPADEQIRRTEPVIRAVRQCADVAISIDTTLAAVAAAALDAGACLLNDISAGRHDPAYLPLAASRGAAVVLMHMRGTPADMQKNPTYANVTAEVTEFLIERRDAALAAGIPRHHILLDPGIGFGKTVEHNLTLLRDLPALATAGPLLVGTSRKRFIGTITGEKPADQRLFGTAATVAWCAAHGAAMVRVHDVAQMVKVVRMIEAIIG